MTSETHVRYCPSCAAKVAEHANAGEMLRCPVCGTQFQASAAGAGETSEQAILRADAPSNAPAGAQRRMSTDEILLERLKHEPPAKRQISWAAVAAIVVAVLGVSYAIYSSTRKPDQYAVPPGMDSAQLFQHRAAMQHTIDSLEKYTSATPNDMSAHLALADAYYDGSYWQKSIEQFKIYLKEHPEDPNARVDYAFAIAQQPHALPEALAQIDTALKYKPDHLAALYNGGLLAVQMTNGPSHKESLDRARNYFERAKQVADSAAPKMALQIDTILQEINRTGAMRATDGGSTAEPAADSMGPKMK